MSKSNKSPLILEEDLISKTVDVQEVEQKAKSKIPNDYIAIKLLSNGKLSAPKTLYFRDYSMDDALELNVLDEEDQLKALVSVFNSMVYEKDFDCNNLHIKELMQIMYSLHGAFISNKIEMEYHINEDLEAGVKEGQLDHPSNIDTVDIHLNKLGTKHIDEDYEGKTMEKKFKEPFTLTDTVKKTKMKFRFNRLGDLLFAQEYCNTKYEELLAKFKPLKKALYKLNDIKDKEERKIALDKLIDDNEDEYDDYYAFMMMYDKDYVKVLQALQIVAVNDVELKTIQEKLEAYKTNVSESLWKMYNKVCTDYDFGILDKYTFYSDKLQKNITRRFRFQYMDFLPDTNKDISERFTVQFD